MCSRVQQLCRGGWDGAAVLACQGSMCGACPLQDASVGICQDKEPHVHVYQGMSCCSKNKRVQNWVAVTAFKPYFTWENGVQDGKGRGG